MTTINMNTTESVPFETPLLPPPPPPLPPICKLNQGARINFSDEPDEESLKNETISHQDSHRSELEQLVGKLFEWKSLNSAAVITVSRFVKHVPQSGPKCGLVALSMASSVCAETAVDTTELLHYAREMGLTNHGEMFSVDYMLQLVKAKLPGCPAQIITDELSNESYVAEQLAAGNVLLVPYDSDRNFGPTCLQGHKAHWAVLTGVIIPVSILPGVSSNPCVLAMTPGSNAVSTIKSYLPAKIHVLALQGKSRYLSAWPYTELVASNRNLIQVDPVREAADIKYVLPPGGVGEGLQGRALLIKCVKH